MKNFTTVFNENISVKTYDTDFKGKIKIASLVQYFQEAASKHASINNFGYNNLLENNSIWVLSSINMRIYEYPTWEEELSIATWSKGKKKIFAVRDFEFYKNEKIYAAGSSFWLIIDINTRKPKKIDDILLNHISLPDKNALNEEYLQIDTPKKFSYTDKFKVKYSDLDINKHVNNLKYIEWAIDALNYDEHQKSIIQMIINYNAECKYDDEIEIKKSYTDNNELIICGYKNEEFKEAFKVFIKLE
jgi:acyl-ACP thioesterase